MISWHRLETDGDRRVVKIPLQMFGDVSDELVNQMESGSRTILESKLREYVEAAST